MFDETATHLSLPCAATTEVDECVIAPIVADRLGHAVEGAAIVNVKVVKVAPLNLHPRPRARNLTFLKSTENATTMALSTFSHVLAAQSLRSGESTHELPDSRRKERIFGAEGSGRLTYPSKPKLGHDALPSAARSTSAGRWR